MMATRLCIAVFEEMGPAVSPLTWTGFMTRFAQFNVGDRMLCKFKSLHFHRGLPGMPPLPPMEVQSRLLNDERLQANKQHQGPRHEWGHLSPSSDCQWQQPWEWSLLSSANAWNHKKYIHDGYFKLLDLGWSALQKRLIECYPNKLYYKNIMII